MPEVLETIGRYTPLGLRLWDGARDEAVVDALRVEAWPADAGRPRRGAFRTASGVYAFERLPGLRLDAAPEGSPVETRDFVVEVADLRRRFTPIALRLGLPLPFPGVFPDGADASPGAHLPGLPLYSSPTRPLSSELAVVRGELHDAAAGRPAAHAWVRLTLPGQAEAHAQDTWDGLADGEGRFAVFFPHPVFIEALASPPDGSPPPAGGLPPLDERRWDLVLEVFYEPDAQTPLAGTALPDFQSLLNQSPALVWREPPTSHPVPPDPEESWIGELEPGRENVVRTLGRSRLLVEPGAS